MQRLLVCLKTAVAFDVQRATVEDPVSQHPPEWPHHKAELGKWQGSERGAGG